MTQEPRFGLIERINICFLAIIRPAKFRELEKEKLEKRYNEELEKPHNEKLSTQPNENAKDRDVDDRLEKLRRGLFQSMLWCVTAAISGSVSACLFMWVYRPGIGLITVFGVFGTFILLWATLAVRGWDIQSIDGVTLSELANRWIFRALYWIGTAFLVGAALLNYLVSV